MVSAGNQLNRKKNSACGRGSDARSDPRFSFRVLGSNHYSTDPDIPELQVEHSSFSPAALSAAKHAATSVPILGILAERWSPRAWLDRPVEDEKLLRAFEAARWAASSANEQSWRFIVARRHVDPSWEDALACLVPGNQEWAQAAPVLVISAARKLTRRDRTYAHAWHDVGLAMGNLSAQATADGLQAAAWAAARLASQ